MQKAKFPMGDGGAADLLGAIGVWGPHDNIKLRQLGLTREFLPELEVGLKAVTALLFIVLRRQASDCGELVGHPARQVPARR